ncbi:MAG: FxLYD domain-containing protein [Candidatus Bathyarchaeia archaeon]|jgi:hypothetical protein
MGKKIVCFCVALLLLSIGLVAVPKTHSQTADVKVKNYSWYVDPEGYLDVVGLVQNVGPNTISSVSLTGTVVGPAGADVADSGTQVWVSDLLPQQEAPFYMEFVSPRTSSTVSWYEVIQAGDLVSIQFNVASANATSSYQYQGLSITSSKASIGTTGGYAGAYVVNGVIKNTGDQTATNLTVVGAFFNSTGSVVGVSYTNYLDPRALVPGNTTTFQIAALDLNQSAVPAALKIKSYQLLVQTQGPILQGATPVVSPQATGTTGPTSSSTAPSSSTNPKSDISSIVPIAIAIVIAIIILAAAVLVVKQVMSRNARNRQTVKQSRKALKQKPS